MPFQDLEAMLKNYTLKLCMEKRIVYVLSKQELHKNKKGMSKWQILSSMHVVTKPTRSISLRETNER